MDDRRPKEQPMTSKIRNEIHKVIVGQDEVVDQVLMCVFCRGHARGGGCAGAREDAADLHDRAGRSELGSRACSSRPT
jgi:hypothetical protein